MIYVNTQLQVIDNTGIKIIKCIKIYKYNKYSTCGIAGDLFLSSIKKYKYKQRYKFKKGQLIKAVLVRTKKK